MLVKDLIFLLQTRGNPDHEVWFNCWIKAKDGTNQQAIMQMNGDFESVSEAQHEYTNGARESYTSIDLADESIKALRSQIKEIEEG